MIYASDANEGIACYVAHVAPSYALHRNQIGQGTSAATTTGKGCECDTTSVDSVRATSVNKGRTSFVHSRRRLVGRTLAAVVCAEVDRDELWRHRGCCERLVEQVVDLVVAPPWVSVVVDPLLGNIRRTRLKSPHRRHVESLLAIIVAKAVEASESAAWCMWHLRNLHKLFCTMTGTNEQQ